MENLLEDEMKTGVIWNVDAVCEVDMKVLTGVVVSPTLW